MSPRYQGGVMYVAVPRHRVGVQQRREARQMLQVLTADLNLHALRIVWFWYADQMPSGTCSRLPIATPGYSAKGFCLNTAEAAKRELTARAETDFDRLMAHVRPGEIPILINARLRPLDVAATIAHEARHAWQHRHWAGRPTDEVERDAEEYAQAMLVRVYGPDRLQAEAREKASEMMQLLIRHRIRAAGRSMRRARATLLSRQGTEAQDVRRGEKAEG